MKILKILLILFVLLTVCAGPVAAQQSETAQQKVDEGEGAEGPSQARKIWDIVWRILNFAILAFIIVKFARRPLRLFLADKADETAARLRESEAVKIQAEVEHKEAEAKLAQMAETVKTLENYMREDAERLRSRILEDAKSNSETIINDAKEMALTEIQRTRERLRAELAELVISEAEKLIRVNMKPADQKRLIDDYMTHLDQAAAA